MTTNPNSNWTKSIAIATLFLVLGANFVSISTLAQSAVAGKSINLSITKVLKDGKDTPTERDSSEIWQVGTNLTATDAVKYQWDNAEINTKYKKSPAKGAGYIKVFLNDTKDENFLVDTGFDEYPFQLSKVAGKLINGKNNLIFAFVDDMGNINNKATVGFVFGGESAKPKITVLKPVAASTFEKDVTQNIELELENFKLSANNDKITGVGKLNIYGNDKNNLLGTVTTGSELANNKFKVEVLPQALNGFDKLPDSKNTKLIFDIIPAGGADPVVSQSVEVVTNFNKTVETSFPSLKFVDPLPTAQVQTASEDRVFSIDIKNFELLNQPPLNNTQVADDKKGFLQIFVDGKPLQTIWQKNTFTLKDIRYTSTEPGEKEIKVQLVNIYFAKLNPEATSKLKINYQPATNSNNFQLDTNQFKDNNWRIIIIILTVILVIGGIVVSVSRA